MWYLRVSGETVTQILKSGNELYLRKKNKGHLSDN